MATKHPPNSHTDTQSLYSHQTHILLSQNTTLALSLHISTHFLMDTVQALIRLHERERNLFLRMREMGLGVEVAKKIIAFWLWLESEGLNGLMKMISFHDDKVLALVCLEAEVALASIQADAAVPSTSTVRLPLTLHLAHHNSFPLEDTFSYRERASSAISHLFNGVCGMIFEDLLRERKGKAKEGGGSGLAGIIQKWVKTVGEGTGREGTVVRGGAGLLGSRPEYRKKKTELPSFVSKLNPFAEEWRPPSEEDRSLYITFSNGFPLTESQIFMFFTMQFGPCLEKVYVHRTGDNRPPQFGRIVLKRSFSPALILHGQEEVRFLILGRSLWCKRFRPKKTDDGCANL
ncbi:unnamed protein product [Ilex paraguariensis]|uniref:Uncharacterized protein n=1 Tax=Ilex paraguariensis TaxID=185542 RepID=A0ABC8RMN1_9AQUA